MTGQLRIPSKAVTMTPAVRSRVPGTRDLVRARAPTFGSSLAGVPTFGSPQEAPTATVQRCGHQACPSSGCASRTDEETPSVQRHAAADGTATATRGGVKLAREVISRSGDPLPSSIAGSVGHLLGIDLTGTRIHTDALAANSARSLGARAYTVGDHVVFGAAGYAPGTAAGDQLLRHELTHVAQAGGVRRGAARRAAFVRGGGLGGGATVSSPHDPAEREATRVASQKQDGESPCPAEARPEPPALCSDTSIFLAACQEAACPAVPFPVPAYGVIWQQAESCLQDKYKAAHPGNTIGTGTSWVGLTGKNAHEKATIDYFRSHYTGKGFKPKKAPQGQFTDEELEREGSRQRHAEPDIFDFTDQVILEITTPAGVPYRAQKIVWEVELATQLMFESGIGGKQLWMPGYWQPAPCYTMPGTGGKGYYRAWNQGGVLTYLPVSDVTNEAYLAAIAAAVAAAGKQMSKGNKGSGPPPVPVPSHGMVTALLVVGAVALAVLLLPEELVAAAGLAILRLGAALITLLGGGSLALAAGGGISGGGSSDRTGGDGEPAARGRPEGGAAGPGGAGPGSAGSQVHPQPGAGEARLPVPAGTTVTGGAPYDETVHRLLQLIKDLNLKDGDTISPEDAERILGLGAELLSQLEAADRNDPESVALTVLVAGLKPRVADALKKVQASHDEEGGGAAPADGASGRPTTTTGSTGTTDRPATVPGGKPDARAANKSGSGGGGTRSSGKDAARKDPTGVTGTGLRRASDQEARDARFEAFQFSISDFDPTRSRTKGDTVEFTISGVVKKKRFRATVTATVDHVEESDDMIVTFVELPSVLVVEGTSPEQAIDKHLRLLTTKKKQKKAAPVRR